MFCSSMSRANGVGGCHRVAQAARNLVLIGDPQQLERPLKGSHPPGAEESALQYLLGDHKTIPETMGLLLPETWRMHPSICDSRRSCFTTAASERGILQSIAFCVGILG